MSRSVSARAPSNIALIKYMGKTDASRNLPANPSLSLTLDRLCTFAELELSGSSLKWVPELPREIQSELPSRAPTLDERGISKILKHVERVRLHASEILGAAQVPHRDFPGAVLRTANTFPSGSGIASSASSFAAVTLVALAACAEDTEVFKKAWAQDSVLMEKAASLSREGSGSSCRSFDGPWVRWEGEDVVPLTAKFPPLSDLVLVVSSREKKVGSSEAHARIKTSPLWPDRPARAQARLALLETALQRSDLHQASQLVWEESLDMHELFHTSEPSFSYFEPMTREILQWIKPHALGQPELFALVTLDAGPNVHVLVPTARAAQWKEMIRGKFPDLEILEDRQGRGARLL